MNDVGVLLAGIGTMISALTALTTLAITVRRGSDRENRRSAAAAVETRTPGATVTPIEPKRGDTG